MIVKFTLTSKTLLLTPPLIPYRLMTRLTAFCKIRKLFSFIKSYPKKTIRLPFSSKMKIRSKDKFPIAKILQRNNYLLKKLNKAIHQK